MYINLSFRNKYVYAAYITTLSSKTVICDPGFSMFILNFDSVCVCVCVCVLSVCLPLSLSASLSLSMFLFVCARVRRRCKYSTWNYASCILL